jgi:hypothetical protein
MNVMLIGALKYDPATAARRWRALGDSAELRLTRTQGERQRARDEPHDASAGHAAHVRVGHQLGGRACDEDDSDEDEHDDRRDHSQNDGDRHVDELELVGWALVDAEERSACHAVEDDEADHGCDRLGNRRRRVARLRSRPTGGTRSTSRGRRP